MSRKRNRSRYRNRKPAIELAPQQTLPASQPSLPAASAAEKGSPLTRVQAVAELLSALDGYSNAAAFLGEDSPLISSGTFRRSGLSNQLELLTTAYRESWLAKRIIDMPCEDMTRAWYSLVTSLPDRALRKLYALEAEHSIQQEMTNAIRWARLYGGSVAVMILKGEDNMMDQPIDPDLLLPDCFEGLLVLDRTQGIEPSPELVTDLDDPDFGLPMYYTVYIECGAESEAWSEKGSAMPGVQQVKIHHSRVLRFIGRELPRMEMVAQNYWGASELEHIWDELQKRCATSANIAQLIFQANITTLKMGDMGAHMALGSDQKREKVLQTIFNENRLRTSYGVQLLSSEDSMETHAYTFGGLSEIYEAFMMDMAGAAEIPATKLFGRSPQGMNSTGEADLRNYYDMIAQMQERVLRPALEKLLPVMAISCWGYVPEDLEIVFEPIMTTSPAERAELVQKLSTDVIEAFKCGLLTREQALEELKTRGEGLGVYTKV